ncbi:MAG: glycosyltransferase family 4 protein [Finegoldia sp.]|nr:glycosyltransferase family 4 protein [Finegoldia sp.]
MKILHVIAQLPKRTGSGVYFKNIVEHMDKSHENAIIYGYEDHFDIEFEDKIKKYPVIFKSEEVPFPIVGMSDVMPYDSTKYSDLDDSMLKSWQDAFLRRIKWAKEEFKPDLVITHHCWMLSSMVIENFEGTPVIVINHGTDIRQTKLNPDLHRKYVTNIGKASMVFALSSNDVDDIVKLFGVDRDKIVLMPGGFDSKIFYRNENIREKDGKIRIIYGGRISHAKGVFELAKAFKILEQKYDNLKLNIVGDVDEATRKELEELSGNSKNLKMHDACCQYNLSHKFRESDIFVLPSYYEGLGLVAMEALACGLLDVTTDIAGLKETLGDKINESGIIEYVPMPKLRTVDEPYEEELDPFVQRLAEGIEKQIIKIKEGFNPGEDIYLELDSKSWKSILERIEKIALELVNK